jgi:DHA2 family multidrug resistance protein
MTMSFDSASWLRVVQVIPIGFIFIPAALAAYVGIPPEKSNDVAGLSNFMRKIGSSVGTSLVTTILAQRTQMHQTMLANYTSLDNPSFRDAVNGLASQLSNSMAMTDAQNQAFARLYGMVLSQASAIAYIDVYWLIGVGSVVMFALAFFLKRNDPHQGGPVAGH